MIMSQKGKELIGSKGIGHRRWVVMSTILHFIYRILSYVYIEYIYAGISG